MLGRKTYTQEELDHATATIADQLAAYDAVRAASGADDAFATFDPLFFNNLVLALDRLFVHRVRPVTGKDGNPLNEVELISESLMLHDGVFTRNKVIKLVPEDSVAQLPFDEPIRLTRDQFGRLAAAFLAEIDTRFVTGSDG